MDHGTTDSEPRRSGSFSHTGSASSSCRRRSISFSAAVPSHIDDEIESETVSSAGDIGDRALQSNRHSEDASLCFSIDHASQNGVAAPTSLDTLLHPYGYWSRDPALNTIPPVSPLPEETISPLSVDAMVCSKDKKQVSLQLIVSHLVVIVKRNSLTYVVCLLTNNENIFIFLYAGRVAKVMGLCFMSHSFSCFWDSWGNMPSLSLSVIRIAFSFFFFFFM